MSFFRKPTPAPKPQSKEAASMSTLYAVLIVIMVVAQLFTFEAFLELFVAFELPGGRPIAYTLASSLIAFQVFALPFLLRMSISPAFRWVSLFSAGIVADIWLFVTIWLVIVMPPVANVGFLGTVVDLQPGVWALFVAVAFGVLAIWATWGLWPGAIRTLTKVSKRTK
jgi:hypothetical protein